jgi:hypothetical protein
MHGQQNIKKRGFFTYISGLRFSAETCSLILTEYNVGLTLTFIYISHRNGDMPLATNIKTHHHISLVMMQHKKLQHSTDLLNSTASFSSKYVTRTSTTVDGKVTGKGTP